MSETTESLLDDKSAGGQVATSTDGVTDPKPAIWQEQVSADFKGHELLNEVTDVNDLTQKYIDQAGKLSNSITKLGENPSDADVKAYREATGVPETPEGYKITHPDMPDGLDYDDAMEAEALKVFHASGASKETAQAAMDFYNNMILEAYSQMEKDAETARVDTKAALEKDWGDNLKSRVEGAEQVIKRFGSENFKLRLEEKGLVFDPEVYRTFDNIKQVLSEDVMMPPAEGGGTDGVMARTKDGTPQLDYSKTMDANGNPK